MLKTVTAKIVCNFYLKTEIQSADMVILTKIKNISDGCCGKNAICAIIIVNADFAIIYFNIANSDFKEQKCLN